jgi:hypothetical protein
MKQEGIITKSRECVKLENGEVFPYQSIKKITD